MNGFVPRFAAALRWTLWRASMAVLAVVMLGAGTAMSLGLGYSRYVYEGRRGNHATMLRGQNQMMLFNTRTIRGPSTMVTGLSVGIPEATFLRNASGGQWERRESGQLVHERSGATCTYHLDDQRRVVRFVLHLNEGTDTAIGSFLRRLESTTEGLILQTPAPDDVLIAPRLNVYQLREGRLIVEVHREAPDRNRLRMTGLSQEAAIMSVRSDDEGIAPWHPDIAEARGLIAAWRERQQQGLPQPVRARTATPAAPSGFPGIMPGVPDTDSLRGRPARPPGMRDGLEQAPR